MAKSGCKDANPILFYDKRNGLTAEYLLVRKEFSCILRSCTHDFLFRCKHFANKWCEQAGGESSVQVGERLREHGCTGKSKRNSIRGVSNSIKSEIWRFIVLFPSLFSCCCLLPDRAAGCCRLSLMKSWWWGGGMLISLSFEVRTVPYVPLHHGEVLDWLYDLRSLGSLLAAGRVSLRRRGIYHFVNFVRL